MISNNDQKGNKTLESAINLNQHVPIDLNEGETYIGCSWKWVELIEMFANMFITMCKVFLIGLGFADVEVGG